MAADYVVGHGRPPVAHQFKKGQSGNPSGRPKGSKNAKAAFLAITNRKVRIREGDKVKYLTQLEVIWQGLAVKAMQRDTKAADTLHKIGKSLGAFEPNPSEAGTYGVIIVPDVMTPEDWDREVGSTKRRTPATRPTVS